MPLHFGHAIHVFMIPFMLDTQKSPQRIYSLVLHLLVSCTGMALLAMYADMCMFAKDVCCAHT